MSLLRSFLRCTSSQRSSCIGRGVLYVIAREGTLKLKGISYAHVEGYSARQKVIRNCCNCRAGFCVASSARELLLVIVEVIPQQLFAYHIATQKGYDVDHKRNLVKAVVTE